MTKIRAKNSTSVYSIPAHSGTELPMEHNVRVEPIDNGYVRTETRYNPDGSYHSSRRFHPTRPGLQSAEKPEAGPSPLRTAIAHAKGKKK